MRRPILAFLVLVAVAIMTSSESHAQTVYVAGASGQFGYFDINTLSYTQISANIGTPAPLALESHGGNLYIKKNFTTFLETITPGGIRNVIGGTSNYSAGLASDGTSLYSISYTTGNFGKFNPVDGVFTEITSSGNYLGIISDGLNFSGGTLYAIRGSSSPGLYSIDPTTGVDTFIGNGGSTFYTGAGGYVNSLFESGGTLYTIHDNYAGLRTLYSIDTSSGNLTNIGVITGGMPSVQAAAIAPPVAAPEPATLSLLALGGLAGLSMCRRRGQLKNLAMQKGKV